MLRSLSSATPVVNAKPVRRPDYSVELHLSGPATLPALYHNLHIVALILSGDPVVLRDNAATRFTRGDCYIHAAGPGTRVTWPAGIHAIYVHLHPRLIRRLGGDLLGTHRLSLEPHAHLRDALLRDMGFELYRLVTSGAGFDVQHADDLVMAIAHHVTARYTTAGSPLPHIGALSIETILDDFRENAPTADSVSRLVTRCGISREHFTRQVRRISGLSPYRMILGSRIELAKNLLERPDMSLSEIAYDTGFADQSHLTRVFKRFTAITPGRYLAQRAAAHS